MTDDVAQRSWARWVRACLGVLVVFTGSLSQAESVVIVLTPHPEEIRQEFESGFSKWHQARYSEPVRI